MEPIGVEAVVNGLQKFLGDMKKMDFSIKSIAPSNSLLGRSFTALGNLVSGFVSSALRVLEYTLGHLIRDAILAVIRGLQELGRQVIAAGNEFQILTVRLQGLNLQDATDSGLEYTAAMKQATAVTKEQMTWLQQLSAATPFDAQDIANTYTLARSYGFADSEARRLTKDITDFVAGMGLSNEVIERVITNLGQMVQRGKITSTEMRDLARGAFLPLNDILKRVAESMGITVEALTQEISTKGGVPAQEFVKAFEQMVEEEPRFVGAAGRLGRTFQAATNNAMDMVRSIGGLSIVKPVLDVIGEKVASLVDNFVKFNEQGELIHTEKWDQLVSAATRVGTALSKIVGYVLNVFIPSTADITSGILDGLNNLADWLETHGDDIGGLADAFKGLFDSMGSDKAGESGGNIDLFASSINSLTTAIIKFTSANAALKAGGPLAMLEVLGVNPQFIQGIISFFTGIQSVAMKVYEWFMVQMWPAFIPFFNWLQANAMPILAMLGAAFVAMWQAIQPSLAELGKAITDVLPQFANAFYKATPVIEAIIVVISALIVVILALVTGILEGAIKAFSVFITSFMAFSNAIWSIIQGIINIVAGLIGIIVGLVVGIFTGNWYILQQSFSLLVDGIGQLISGLGMAIVSAFSMIFAPLLAFVGGFVDGVIGFFVNLYDELVGHSIIPDMMNSMVGIIIGGLSEIINSILGWIPGVSNALREVAKEFYARALGWLEQAGFALLKGYKGLIQTLTQVLALIQAAIKPIIIPVQMGSVGGTSSYLTAPGSGGSSTTTTQSARDSGGTGIPNVSYLIGTGAQPEVFTPTVSGMFTPVKQLMSMLAPQVNSQYQSKAYYNLTINTNAKVEPILQDFAMLQSMQGL